MDWIRPKLQWRQNKRAKYHRNTNKNTDSQNINTRDIAFKPEYKSNAQIIANKNRDVSNRHNDGTVH